MADDPRTGKENGNQEEEEQEEHTRRDPEPAEESVQNGSATAASPSLRTPSRSNGLSTSSGKQPSKSSGKSNDGQNVQAETSARPGASARLTKFEENLQGGQNEMDIGAEPASNTTKTGNGSGITSRKDNNGRGQSRAQESSPCGSSGLFERRTPFEHNPPIPEERRPRISHPRCFKDYIINMREDLADFQESHGLPRTRDYSFLSLGLSLTQETGRAIYAVFLMITELFPIVAIVSLFLRFTLDKVIEILETEGTVPRVKKIALFGAQIIIMMIPLWILVGTIIIPMFYLVLSIVRRLFHLSGRGSRKAKTTNQPVVQASPKGKKRKLGCF